MSKAVLISIQPEWCSPIVTGQKTLEVRKTRPKLETPFKCYIYATKAKLGWFDLAKKERFDGKVIGEFVCDNIRCFDVPYPAFQKEMDKRILDESCCTYYQLHRYAYHDALYGWNISGLVIYDKPKELGEFYVFCDRCDKKAIMCEYGYEENNENGYYSECMCDFKRPIKRPPQSWCYVEELKGGAK